jgi:hypothetical protein
MKNKMQPIFYLISILLFFSMNAFSQDYTFQKLYGDSAFDGLTIVQCSDGSFLYAGSKFIAGDYDLIVMKTHLMAKYYGQKLILHRILCYILFK